LGTGIGVARSGRRTSHWPTEGFAEVGHMILDPTAPVRLRQSWLLEALAARDAIIRRAIFALQQGVPSNLLRMAKGELDSITPRSSQRRR